MMRHWGQDFRMGVRALRKRPLWTLTAAATLALGIGAHTAVFSVVHDIFVNPLPFRDARRLVTVGESIAERGLDWSYLSRSEYLDCRDTLRTIQVGAFEPHVANWNRDGNPLQLRAGAVSVDFFRVLGVSPLIGRDFRPEDGDQRVAILSDAFFRAQLGGRDEALSEPLLLGDDSYQIIGVTPPGFGVESTGLSVLESQDIWYPLYLNVDRSIRRGGFTRVIGRLADGVSLDQAIGELSSLGRAWHESYPDFYSEAGYRLWARPLTVWALGDSRPAVLAFAVAVAFVLLLICLNLANLHLARAESRSGEIAVRLALGAGRWRVARQFFAEGALLAVLGSVGGILLASWGISLLRSVGPQALPRFAEVSIGWVAAVAALGAALLSAVLFSLLPLLPTIVRLDTKAALASFGRVAGSGSNRLRSSLVIGQVALALLLLFGGGLMARSLQSVLAVDPGFRTQDVFSFRLVLSSGYREDVARMQYFDRVLERIGTLPEVTAGLVSRLPLHWEFTEPVAAEGEAVESSRSTEAATRYVGGDYFASLGIELLKGRLPDSRDDQNGAPAVVVDEKLAERLWAGADPLGRRLRRGGEDWRSVIGVVRHVKHRGLEGESAPQLYIPMRQALGFASSMFVTVRKTDVDRSSFAVAMREAVWSVDATIPLSEVGWMDDRLDGSLQSRRFTTSLFGFFSAVGLLIGGLGLFGVVSLMVNQRVREIGVRMAIGAAGSDILRLVLRRGMLLCVLGLAAGIPLSLLAARFLSNLLYGVAPGDLWVLGSSAVFLGSVALAACYLPARRAARLDPAIVLKYE